MPDNETPRDAAALAFNMTLMVPAPEGVDDAISEVMGRHEDEFNAALEPFGVTLGVLAQATWMRLVRTGDVQALYGGQVHSSVLRGALGFDDVPEAGRAIAEGIAEGLQREPGVPFGERVERSLPLLGRRDDCSSGEACGAQCSAVAVEYCPATREADDMSCLFRVGHTGAHDYSRIAPGSGSGWVAPSEVAYVDPEEAFSGRPPEMPRLSREEFERAAFSEPRVVRGPVFGEGAREVHPEPRQDAAVLGAPGEAMSTQTPEDVARLIGNVRALQADADANGYGRGSR